METLLYICLVFLGLLLFGFLCLYIWFAYSAYKIKKIAERFMGEQGEEILKRNISKFQQRMEEQINKKRDK